MYQENLYIDKKYADYLSTSLLMFQKVKNSPYTANFRCNICGDSSKDKFKTRGYILEKDGRLHYFCHNCGASVPFYRYMKEYHNDLFSQMVMEKFSDKKYSEDKTFIEDEAKPKVETKKIIDYMKGVKKISQLSFDHKAKKYVEYRQIPSNQHYKLFYEAKFFHWINHLVPDTFGDKALQYDSGRLILPFKDFDGKIFGCTGRSFTNSDKGRYIVILFDSDKPKTFGLDTINVRETVRVLEGPIDSLFVKNSMAMCGTDVNFERLPTITDRVFILDNEPRNVQVVKKYEKYIEKEEKIVIWPSDNPHKDVNDMVMAGIHPIEIDEIFRKRTYQGLEAMMMLNEWRKV